VSIGRFSFGSVGGEIIKVTQKLKVVGSHVVLYCVLAGFVALI